MSENVRTSKIIDEVIRFTAGGTFVVSTIIAPGAANGLQKPLAMLLKHLDANEKERELKRIVYYMKSKGYLAGEYEHGLQLTEKARKRYQKLQDIPVTVQPQDIWDRWWRIILYDIPEDKKSARKALQWQLRRYGCHQLQRSVLITPFPCLEDIKKLAAANDIDQYVSYFEAKNLSNDKVLIRRFQKQYPTTKF